MPEAAALTDRGCELQRAERSNCSVTGERERECVYIHLDHQNQKEIS